MTAYIYALIDPRNNEPRYIGKSIEPKKRLESHIHAAKNTPKYPVHRWIKKLISEGFLPKMEVIDQTDGDWRGLEIALIDEIRSISGSRLLNITAGGDGVDFCSTPFRKRIWTVKHKMGLFLSRHGKYHSLDDIEPLKAKLRFIGWKHPEHFGEWMKL